MTEQLEQLAPSVSESNLTQEIPAISHLRNEVDSFVDRHQEKLLLQARGEQVQFFALHEGINQEALETLRSSEDYDVSILSDYISCLKSTSDMSAEQQGIEPRYGHRLELLKSVNQKMLRKYFELDPSPDNPLMTMVRGRLMSPTVDKYDTKAALEIVAKMHNLPSSIDALSLADTEESLARVVDGLKDGSGVLTFKDMYSGFDEEALGDPEKKRVWLRNTLMYVTGLTDPNLADDYTYGLSKDSWWSDKMQTLVHRVDSYGPEKLSVINEFCGVHALAYYTDEQLGRMYELATGNVEEIERLKAHDTIAVFSNREGDHNAINNDVASRIDDEASRTLFFEVNRPEQVYIYMKRLHDLGIAPSTLVFASHGSAGQYFISEKPALDSNQETHHVTFTDAQAFLDEYDIPSVKAYDIKHANGLIRSVQRFMQPSRGIDDSLDDIGRKKLISLSCEFDTLETKGHERKFTQTEAPAQNSLMRALGRVLLEKLPDEQIDIYGADISTKSSARTDKGFHYNTLNEGVRVPYKANVLRLSDGTLQWYRQNQVLLRK